MRLIRFLVFSNLWISLGASCIALMTFLFTEREIDINLILFVYFSTLFSYTFQRLARLSKLKIETPELWIVSHEKKARIILILSLVGLLIFNPIYSNFYTIFPIALLGIVSLAYSYKGLRDFPMIKIFLIAASWGILCGIIPTFYPPLWNSTGCIPSFFWIFFYILAITIPFDIRDIHIDEKEKNTLPQLLGLRGSKVLALVFLSVSFLCIFTISSSTQSLFFLFSFLVASVLILKSSPTNKPLYFGLLVDGHIIFQFIGVYFFC